MSDPRMTNYSYDCGCNCIVTSHFVPVEFKINSNWVYCEGHQHNVNDVEDEMRVHQEAVRYHDEQIKRIQQEIQRKLVSRDDMLADIKRKHH